MKQPVILKLQLEELGQQVQGAVALHHQEIEAIVDEEFKKAIAEFDFEAIIKKLVEEEIAWQIENAVKEKIEDVLKSVISSSIYDTENYSRLKAKVAKQMTEIIEKKFK